ncbi:hypothetical protein LINPERPRIM_LOCUS32856 [Linum perenne]
MPELAAHIHRDQLSTIPAAAAMFGARDFSPDSVIFTPDSNFSHFSSASASVDRSSFASDAYDYDSLASEFSSRLAVSGVGLAGDGAELELDHLNSWSTGGPHHHRDPNPKKATEATRISSTKRDNVKAQKDDRHRANVVNDGENQLLDSARSSFSLALKECQDRRSRSEAVAKNADRRRPASFDLNNVLPASSSPRLEAVKNSPISSTRKLGMFPSPGTPNYRHESVGLMQTGWSSERVPLHASGNRRQLSGGGLFPYNNGRALPSKWEDAERWIFSPVSGDGLVRTSLRQPHRRPKAKSGPLGPPGVAYYSLYSPTAPVVEGRNFTVGSPFSAGVFGADGLGGPANCHGVGFPVRTDPCMARSVSVHGCSEVVAQTTSSSSQEDKVDCVEDAATDISRVVSRRDMATQMSPASSNHSSPSKRLSLMDSTPSALPIVEVQSFQSPRSEVRDVQVDETVTVTRWSRKHRGSNNHSKGSEIVDWRKKVVGCRSSAWEVSETSTNFSK